MIHVYKTKVRERMLDLFQHMNNAAYMTLFEEARWERITEAGYGVDRVRETGIGFVVLKSEIRYKHEVKNREDIEIRTECVEVLRKMVRLKQTMVNLSASAAVVGPVIAAEAEFVIGCFDTQARRLIEPPADWLAAVL